MGRFEELVEKAREGDSSALDDLGTEFSGSALRKEAEAGTAAQKQLEEQAPLVRKARLTELVDDLPEELKGVTLSVDDFGDVDPKDITIETVSAKARSKQEASEAHLREMATSQGFESMEAFQEALDATKQEGTDKKKAMENIGGGTGSGSGSPVPVEDPEPFDSMKETYEAARQRGQSQDKAMGHGMEAMLTAQAPVEVDEGH